MNSSEKIMVALGILILAGGIFLALKGKSSMIRERFGSGVSPENERKFMATLAGLSVLSDWICWHWWECL